MSPPRNLRAASDQELAALALEGSQEAHAELYHRYHGPVHTLLYHMVGDHHLVEDLTQVTFFNVSRELHSYRPEHKFSAWIFSIANHVGVDHVRKTKNQLDTLTLDNSPIITSPSGKIRGIQVAAATDSTPSPVRLARDLGPALKQAMERLRPQYRHCLTLRFLQNRSYQDIARITHLPAGTVASHLLRALLELREILGRLADSSRSNPPPPPA